MADCFDESSRLIEAIDEVLLPRLHIAAAASGWEYFRGKKMFVGQNSFVQPSIVFVDEAKEAISEATDDLEDYLSGRSFIYIVPEDAISQTAPTSAPSPAPTDFRTLEEIRDRYLAQLEYDVEHFTKTPMQHINAFAEEVRSLLISNALHGLDECLRAQRG